MKISDVKLYEIVHITQKSTEYSWNSTDIIGRVEGINEKEVHLLLPTGEIHKIQFDRGEKYEPAEVTAVTDYLFLDEIEKCVENAKIELVEKEKKLQKIMQFRHDFVHEMSFFARLKTFLRQ